MTLLITVAGHNYALSCSDMRISIQSGKKYVSIDEKFNKHIMFNSGGFRANISYTGVAQWKINGKKIRLYDVISDSLAKSSKEQLSFFPLCLKLISDISISLNKKILRNKDGKLMVELHITGYHDQIPHPFIAVISTFRNSSPWNIESEYQWEYKLPEMNLYLKFADSPEVVFGGMDTALSIKQKKLVVNLARKGVDAYNISKKCAELIKAASSKHSSIGSRSVAVLVPEQGFSDTNLWAEENGGIVAFLPRIVFSNGSVWGPSEFPVSLSLHLDGYLPMESLFFKSIIDQHSKRRVKRLYFRRTKGNAIPGIFGILGLSLFGKVPDGCADFGLSSVEDS